MYVHNLCGLAKSVCDSGGGGGGSGDGSGSAMVMTSKCDARHTHTHTHAHTSRNFNRILFVVGFYLYFRKWIDWSNLSFSHIYFNTDETEWCLKNDVTAWKSFCAHSLRTHKFNKNTEMGFVKQRLVRSLFPSFSYRCQSLLNCILDVHGNMTLTWFSSLRSYFLFPHVYAIFIFKLS